tara:strand:+ start:464 stop:940 length:477 start_codon:yes stop_codon:yes gene_type:complete
MEFADYFPQIAWSIFAFSTLYFLMAKLALPRITNILESRQRRLDQDLELAEKLRDEATAALAGYESLMAAAHAKTEIILLEARETLQRETVQRLDALKAQLESKVTESERRIQNIMAQAVDEVVVAASVSARSGVKKLIGLEVSEEQARAAVDAVRKP